MRKVATYVRVSTQEQAKHGYSVAEQSERLEKYCEARGWSLVASYADPGQSGAYMDRAGLQRLIRDVQVGAFDTVLVWKLDRLSRSQKDCMFMVEDVFLKNRIDFISMNENFDTTTPFGRAMVGVLSVFAQLDRDQITERMSMGRVGRAKAGYFSGGSRAPIGYDYVRSEDPADPRRILKVNQYEAMQVRMVFDLWLHGLDGRDLSFGDIASYMAGRYRTRYGSWETKSTVSRLLQNRIYVGEVSFSGEWYPGIHEPIVSPETFGAAQEKIRRYSEHFQKTSRNFAGGYLLSGVLRCGICGGRYFVSSRKNTHVTAAKPGMDYYRSYACYSRRKPSQKMVKLPTCRNRIIKLQELDEEVLEEIRQLARHPSEIRKLQAAAAPPKSDREKVLLDRIRELDRQASKLIDLYQLGTFDIAAIKERSDALQKEKESLSEELRSLGSKPGRVSEEEARSALASFSAAVKSGDVARQRAVVRALIDEIVIFPDDIEIRWSFVGR